MTQKISEFNQARGVLSQFPGTQSNIVQQLPEREIDLEWIKRKGESENDDFRKCQICLMDYDHGERVRTLPCCNYIYISQYTSSIRNVQTSGSRDPRNVHYAKLLVINSINIDFYERGLRYKIYKFARLASGSVISSFALA